MSTKRAEFLKTSKKFGFPLFCGAWAAEKSNAAGVVILAGGGGEGRHGIKSKIILAQYDKKADDLSDEVSRRDMRMRERKWRVNCAGCWTS